MIVVEIKEALSKIYRSLKAHIGAGDSAHLVATPFNDGFLSAEDKVRYDRSSGRRVFLGGGADILTLEEGQYDGFNFINGPLTDVDASMLSVSVIVGENYSSDGTKYSRKQLSAIRSHDGKIFERTVHQSGGNMGWRTVEQKRLLWNGTASAPQTVITLSESKSKFSYLELEYTDGKTGVRNEKFPIRNDLSLNTTNVSNGVGTSTVEFIEARVTISGDKLTIEHNRRLTTALSNASLPTILEEAEMTILNVWGIV